MAIQVRRGNEVDFDPSKMLPGEWAVSLDTRYVRMCFSPGICLRMATYEAFEADTEKFIEQMEQILSETKTVQEAVERIQSEIEDSVVTVENYVASAKRYSDISNTYAMQSKQYAEESSGYADDAYDEAERAKTYAENAEAVTGIEIAKQDRAGIIKGGDNYIAEDGTLQLMTQTTDTTLLHSYAGGIKLNSIEAVASEQKQYSGKNLYNNTLVSRTEYGITFTMNEDGSVTMSGTATKQAYVDLYSSSTALIDGISPNVDYIYSLGNSHENVAPVLFSRVNDKWVGEGITSSATWGLESNTLNIGEDATGMIIRLQVKSGATLENYTVYPMIRLATVEDDTYEPYVGATPSPNPIYPQEIESVGDSGSLGIKAEGKNLFNPDSIISSYASYEDGVLTVHQIGGSSDILFNAVFKENTQYTLSAYSKPTATVNYNCVRVRYTDGTSEVALFNISSLDYEYRTFTTKEDKTVEAICNSEQNGYLYLKELQIEEGTVATPYEPYRSKSITIPLNEPLRGIGEVKDEIVCQDGVWYINRNVASEVFDGSEDGWVMLATNHGDGNLFYIPLENLGVMDTSMSTQSLLQKNVAVLDMLLNHHRNTSGNFYIVASFSTLDDWKTHLAENPITVQYELATPTFEPLTDQTPFYGLESFDTVTYITTDSEIEPLIELEYGTSKVGEYTLDALNTAKINKIKISNLENDINVVGGKVDAIGGDIDNLNSDIDNLNSEINVINSNLSTKKIEFIGHTNSTIGLTVNYDISEYDSILVCIGKNNMTFASTLVPLYNIETFGFNHAGVNGSYSGSSYNGYALIAGTKITVMTVSDNSVILSIYGIKH